MGKTYKKFKGKKYPDKESKNRKADRSCLNHGSCSYCLSNRTHKNNKKIIDVDELNVAHSHDTLYAIS